MCQLFTIYYHLILIPAIDVLIMLKENKKLLVKLNDLFPGTSPDKHAGQISSHDFIRWVLDNFCKLEHTLILSASVVEFVEV